MVSIDARLVEDARATQVAPLTKTKTYVTIQALRAVAALLVVAYHAFDLWMLRIDVNTPHRWPNGAAGVDIFFVVSGFVMVVASRRLVERVDGWAIFLRHRIQRIVPLYWLVTTFKLVAVLLFAGFALRSKLDMGSVIGSYLFLPVVDGAGHFRPLLPIGWTLTYEFLFYGFFALALALCVDVLRVLIPALLAFVVLALLHTPNWPEWTILFNTIVLEFLFGVCLAKLTLRSGSLPPAVAVIAIVGGFALILLPPDEPALARPIVWGLPALAIVAGAVALETRVADLLPRWLLRLGDASYSIYLVHGFVLPIVGVAVLALHSTSSVVLAVTVIASLVVGSLAGWFVYVLVERPMLRWMARGLAVQRHLTMQA